VKNPCFETLRRHDVKFRKACERSVRTREACEVRVKYRNFSVPTTPPRERGPTATAAADARRLLLPIQTAGGTSASVNPRPSTGPPGGAPGLRQRRRTAGARNRRWSSSILAASPPLAPVSVTAQASCPIPWALSV